MKKKLTLVLFLLITTVFSVNAQALFPEKFSGCMTAAMVLKSDTAKWLIY